MRSISPFTVIFLFDSSGEEALLLERSPKKKLFPGLYTGIGGKIDIKDGENDPWVAMQREFEEETQIPWNEIGEKKMVAQVSRREKEESILMFVFSGKIEKEKFSLSCTEGILHWVKKEDVMPLPLIPTSRLVLKNFFLKENLGNLESVKEAKKDDEIYFAIVNKDYSELLAFPQ